MPSNGMTLQQNRSKAVWRTHLIHALAGYVLMELVPSQLAAGIKVIRLALTEQHGVGDAKAVPCGRLYSGNGTQSRQEKLVLVKQLQKQKDRLLRL